METVVYLLCGLLALVCGILLLRGYLRTRARLLLWCSFFFFALTLENVILFVDLILMPKIDISLVRNSVALGGVLVLLYGLIMETK